MCTVAERVLNTNPNDIEAPVEFSRTSALQDTIDGLYQFAGFDAGRSAYPIEEDRDSKNSGLTRREMLAGMALPGAMFQESDPVKAAVKAVKAADAVMLLVRMHDFNTSSVSPVELLEAISPIPLKASACRCHS